MTEGNNDLSLNLLKSKYIVFLSVVIELILFYFYYFPETKNLLGDEHRYLNIGKSISEGGDWHSHPFWPPMQSIVIAVFIKLFSNPILPLQLFQYLLLLCSGFIVRNITYRETKNQTAAQIALAVMLLYPSWLAYSQYLWPEVIHVFLFVLIIWINNYKYHSIKWMLLSGMLLGLAILFKSLLILFIPFLYLPVIIRSQWKQFSIRIALSLLVTVAVLAPASYKAHQMTGGWMVSNSSMFNLNLGLHDHTRQHFTHKIAGAHYNQFHSTAKTFEERNKIVTQKALNKITDDGYINTILQQLNKQYFRLFDYQSTFSQQFQSDEKGNYQNRYKTNHNNLLVKSFLIFNSVFYTIIMLGMFFGIVVSFRHSRIAQQFALFLLYTLGLFLLLHAIPRFRIPLVPIMGFYSGYLFYYVKSKMLENIPILPNKTDKLMATFIVIFVILLVFSAELLDKYYPI